MTVSKVECGAKVDHRPGQFRLCRLDIGHHGDHRPGRWRRATKKEEARMYDESNVDPRTWRRSQELEELYE